MTSTLAQQALDLYYTGSTEQKISRTNELFALHGKSLLREERIIKALRQLKDHSKALSEQMLLMKLDRLCSKCAGTDNGGCCSSYMEANSNVILLLINRLYGVLVEEQHQRGAECCFLGPRGCILPIKPVFCLNYNCKHITGQASKQDMTALEQASGQVLGQQTQLEDMIVEYILK